jgi:hypothetical protein
MDKTHRYFVLYATVFLLVYVLISRYMCVKQTFRKSLKSV